MHSQRNPGCRKSALHSFTPGRPSEAITCFTSAASSWNSTENPVGRLDLVIEPPHVPPAGQAQELVVSRCRGGFQAGRILAPGTDRTTPCARRGVRSRVSGALLHEGNSSYTLARMKYAILLAPEAVIDLRGLRANLRSQVREAIEAHLRHEPAKVSKSRIKRLRGLARPQYRLRIDEVRVFYDITGNTVEVLAIVAKSEAESWLAQFGNPR
jgi:mRNA interferase RelE/StbE